MKEELLVAGRRFEVRYGVTFIGVSEKRHPKVADARPVVSFVVPNDGRVDRDVIKAMVRQKINEVAR